LVEKSEEKGSFQIPRSKWKDNIKIDLKEIVQETVD
jgi:hypothetical protein